MLNNYDLQMGLVAIGPIGFVVSALLVAGIGWLVSKK
jgi:hypothetical protein